MGPLAELLASGHRQTFEFFVAGLRDDFGVPQVAVKVWGVGEMFMDAHFAQGASEDAQAFASSRSFFSSQRSR